VERIKPRLAYLALAATLAACARFTALSPATWGASGNTSQTSAHLIPRVQNCGVLDAGSPSRFVCNGKVYTSFQLAKLRENEAKKYASGQ
jgi:hypothetical protein